MKAHIHKDEIIAWANGAEIEIRPIDREVRFSCSDAWVTCEYPSFRDGYEYRVKPREFKEGAFYPVKTSTGKDFARYADKGFHFGDLRTDHTADTFIWIGEELQIDWPI